MPVIPVNLDEIHEMKPAPIGKYVLVVVDCEEVLSKKGKPQYSMSIAVEGRDDVPNIRHFVSLPAEGDAPEAFKFKVLMLKRLGALFGQPLSGNSIDTTKIAMSLVGAKATAEVGLDTEKDQDGNERVGGRTYNRLVVPFLKDEGSKAGGRVAPPPPKS